MFEALSAWRIAADIQFKTGLMKDVVENGRERIKCLQRVRELYNDLLQLVSTSENAKE